MKRSRPLLATLLVGAFVLPILGIAAFVRAGRQPLPPPDAATYERFWSRAADYDRFVAGDTARRAQWIANRAAAPASVAPLVARARAVPGRWHLLVVAESWCRDAVNTVPYLAELAARDTSVELRLLRRDEAKRLLRAHLLDGRRATPLVVLLDDRFVERGAWIEQPLPLRAIVREEEGKLSEDSLRAIVSQWYAADSGRTTLAELLAVMERGVGAR